MEPLPEKDQKTNKFLVAFLLVVLGMCGYSMVRHYSASNEPTQTEPTFIIAPEEQPTDPGLKVWECEGPCKG